MAMLQLQGVARRFVTWSDPYDVVLTPSLAQAPLPIGAIDPDAPDPHETFRDAGRFTPFTAIANITGQPAISLPLSMGDDGLPRGAHFFGRPADEATLLALATQLETARPWADRRAPVASLPT
jgi:amidase